MEDRNTAIETAAQSEKERTKDIPAQHDKAKVDLRTDIKDLSREMKEG
jgi:hypothetical protein